MPPAKVYCVEVTRTSAADPRVARVERLDAGDVDEVLALAGVASAADGTDPLSEHVMLRLRHAGTAPATQLTIREPDGSLVGYACLAAGGEAGEPASAELVVHPMHRRRGRGRALVEAMVAAAGAEPSTVSRTEPSPVSRAEPSPVGQLRVWAHGDHPSAAALALDLGFDRARVLWQMRRPLRDPLPEPQLPAGVSLRAFRPGEDDEAWVAVNRRAFAGHPEQGRWTVADLRLRLAEPWFDRNGFLLATEDSTGRVLGFHWTKVHGRTGGTGPADPPAAAARPGSVAAAGRPGAGTGEAGGGAGEADAGTNGIRPPEPIGEVYVLGVDPDAHRLSLGTALTVAGLRHLRDHGLTRVMLYVDESNPGAVALYTRLGFANWMRNVQYRWVAGPSAPRNGADRQTP